MLLILEQQPHLPVTGGEAKLWNLQITARTYITRKAVALHSIAFLHTLFDDETL